MRRRSRISVQQTTQGSPPRLPFARMKEAVLGAHYDLSVAFVGDRRSHTLNRRYRRKDAPANVLAFPLSEYEGELIIAPAKATRDAKHFNMSPRAFIGYLFIHGLLHLKGHRHGSTMESEEKKLLKKFSIR